MVSGLTNTSNSSMFQMKMLEQIEVLVSFTSFLEMSFVEQEDVFNVVEKLMVNVFKKFSSKKLSRKNFKNFFLKVTKLWHR